MSMISRSFSLTAAVDTPGDTHDGPSPVGPSVPSLRALDTVSRRRRMRAACANPVLWALQGWLAMFFIAAGYAKLTQPRAILVELLSWPAHTAPTLVTLIGWSEVALAVLMLSPLASWRFGPAMLAATALLTASAAAMAIVHALDLQLGHVITNLVLVTIGLGVLFGRSAWPRPARTHPAAERPTP